MYAFLLFLYYCACIIVLCNSPLYTTCAIVICNLLIKGNFAYLLTFLLAREGRMKMFSAVSVCRRENSKSYERILERKCCGSWPKEQNWDGDRDCDPDP